MSAGPKCCLAQSQLPFGRRVVPVTRPIAISLALGNRGHRVHRRERRWPRGAVTKAAPEDRVERRPSSTRVAIENWAKQQKDNPPARTPFAARAWLALDAMPCCYWNLWLSVSARMCIISCIDTHDTECGHAHQYRNR
jgi:hypothetical protein